MHTTAINILEHSGYPMQLCYRTVSFVMFRNVLEYDAGHLWMITLSKNDQKLAYYFTDIFNFV